MMTRKEILKEVILGLAVFFNPVGYNEVFAGIMHYTKSYWITSCIFYGISGGLFITYFLIKRFYKKSGELPESG